MTKGLRYLALGIFLLSLCFSCYSPQASSAIETRDSEYLRPQLHYSPKKQWMNDPNGMFYYNGHYHLFYQHYPDSNVWGPMHWGHASSTDLIHWTHQPIALYPDSLGMIFSGSAVVDFNNTSGLQDGEHPPIVALYTYHDPIEEAKGTGAHQSQGLAYSLDGGWTWNKYAGNPVLPNSGKRDFRDPKVFWFDQGNYWVMTLAIGDHIEFYQSTDLIHWLEAGQFGKGHGSHGGVWECPDLIPFSLADGSIRYVLLVSIGSGGPNGGSATQYFVGTFDGSSFVLDPTFESSYLGVTPAVFPDGQEIVSFEKGYSELSSWSGEAAGNAPAKGTLPGQNVVKNYQGEYLLNTFRGGDSAVGNIKTKAFVLNKDYLNFRIGGGMDAKNLRVDLINENGNILQSWTGRNSEHLHIVSWNTEIYGGQKVYLNIVDSARGGWGHLLLDDVVLSDYMAYDEMERAQWLDWGTDNYAGVTWSNAPSNEKLFLGWMSNWQYANQVPTKAWRSHMTLPRQLFLNEDLSVSSMIIHQFDSLHKGDWHYATEEITSVPVLHRLRIPLDGIDYNGSEFVWSNGHEQLILQVSKDKISLDRTQSGLTEFSPAFPSIQSAPLLSSVGEKDAFLDIIIDRTSIEVLSSNGKTVLSALFFPENPYNQLEVNNYPKGKLRWIELKSALNNP